MKEIKKKVIGIWNSIKEKLAVRPVIIIVIIILGCYGSITPGRIVRFIIILGVILLYSRLLRWVSDNLEGYMYKYMKDRGEELWLLNRWLVRIHRYKNPVLIAVCKIDIKTFDLVRWVNWKFLKKEKVRLWIYIIITNIISRPILILINKYYEAVIRWVDSSKETIIYKRLFGLILSVLIFTNVIQWMLRVIGFYKLIMIMYLIVVMIGVIESVSSEVYDVVLYEVEADLMDTQLNRASGTLTGIIIGSIPIGLLDAEKYKEKLKIDKKYLHYVPYWHGGFYMGVGFYEHWEGNKMHILGNCGLMKKEIKNRPSRNIHWVLYELVKRDGVKECIGAFWYLERERKGKIKEGVYEKIKFLYEYEKKRLKVLLYLIWDIEDYLGYKKYNKMWIDKGYGISLEFEESTYGYENTMFMSKEVSLVKQEEGHKIEDSKFLDVELNYQYYKRLYSLVYIVDYEGVVSTSMDKLYYSYLKDEEVEWETELIGELREIESYNIKYESEVREMLLKLAEGLRPEWEEEKGKEEMEERNERRLKELERLVERELKKMESGVVNNNN
jgi:hypothetical protein